MDRTREEKTDARARDPVDVVIVAPPRTDVGEFMDTCCRGSLLRGALCTTHRPLRGRLWVAARTWWSWISGSAAAGKADPRLGGSHGKSRALVITEAHEVDARLSALDLGAADHLSAPFEIREALARVDRLIAQQREPRSSRVVAGDLTIDLAERSHFGTDGVWRSRPEKSACSSRSSSRANVR